MKGPAHVLSVIILTKNEQLNLPYALESLKGLDAKIYVVDSGSRDATLEIAKRAGCRIAHHDFVTHAKQLNWALTELGISTPWVMRLDADERLTAELRDEIKSVLPLLPSDVSGVLIKRRVYFWGRWIRYGGYYPTWLLRIWRNGTGRFEERWMDEHLILSQGGTRQFSNDLIDENYNGLSAWIEKHNGYADREVRDILSQQPSRVRSTPSGQAGRRRWLKQNLYASEPLFLRAALYWFWRYFVRLGFLDGRAGLVFHFLQGFWYRFLIDAKLVEARRKARRADGTP